MELGEYLDILRRRWLGVLIIALVTLALASTVTLVMPKKYTATTRAVHCGCRRVSDRSGAGIKFCREADVLVRRGCHVATGPDACDNQLGLRTTPKELAESVEATVPVDTVILEIAATDPDPTRAAQIANAVGDELAKAAGDLSPQKERRHQSGAGDHNRRG